MTINPIITDLKEQIIRVCSPEKLILVSNKLDTKGQLISFKVCVIVNDVLSVAELEGKLYLETDCQVPFDLIIYNKSEWDDLIDEIGTFAEKVNNTGVVLYG